MYRSVRTPKKTHPFDNKKNILNPASLFKEQHKQRVAVPMS